MQVGGYSLDLYCDRSNIPVGQVYDKLGHEFNEFPHQFFGQNETLCKRKAQARGWVLGETDLCPKCNPRLQRKPR